MFERPCSPTRFGFVPELQCTRASRMAAPQYTVSCDSSGEKGRCHEQRRGSGKLSLWALRTTARTTAPIRRGPGRGCGPASVRPAGGAGRARGELVSKDELLARVWPKLVVEENNLQVQVSALRKILGQDAIATVPGHGYRFALQLEGHASGTSRVPAAPKHNLPRPLTRFIGREDALAECAQILERVRLLTLTGIGGCGKTRLAIRLAELFVPSFDGDVCFVDLAPIAEPGRVALSVATAFDVREEPDKTIEETLVRHFADRRALLVLDNCEHLLDACVALAEPLLRAAPRLHILVTSREGLGIAGERMFAVQSLAMP